MRYDRKLSRMPFAQCGVNFDEHGGIKLVSYSTVVIDIDPMGWLVCTGTYSQTTRKHISAFLKEYAPNIGYYDAKGCFENKMTINIHTREVQPLE